MYIYLGTPPMQKIQWFKVYDQNYCFLDWTQKTTQMPENHVLRGCKRYWIIMKYVIHKCFTHTSAISVHFPFPYRCTYVLSRRTCIIWYVCVHSACMDHHFWHILTMWDWEHVFSKILWPKLPAKRPQKSRKRAQKLSNARKSRFLVI